MKRDDADEPQRWSGPDAAAHANVSAGLNGLRAATADVPASRLARVRAGIHTRLQQRFGASQPLAFVVAAVVFLLATGVASAVVFVRKWSPASQAPSPKLAAPTQVGRTKSRLAGAMPQSPVAGTPTLLPMQDPLAGPTPAVPDAKRLHHRRSLSRGASPFFAADVSSPAPQAAEPPITFPAIEVLPGQDAAYNTEAMVLLRVVRSLRRQHDPRLALAQLDEYASRFPLGFFQSEAIVARTEAYLALGDRQQALELLQMRKLADLPRPRPLFLLRADLLAVNGRCESALADFDAAMGSQADDVAERALRGRSICRARLGDQAGAQADLKQHMQMFAGHPRVLQLKRSLGLP